MLNNIVEEERPAIKRDLCPPRPAHFRPTAAVWFPTRPTAASSAFSSQMNSNWLRASSGISS